MCKVQEVDLRSRSISQSRFWLTSLKILNMNAIKVKSIFGITRVLRPSAIRLMGSLGTPESFEKAVKRLSSLKNDPGNETKLKLYAFYKQATVGKCNIPKPGMMDFAGKMKWEAWNGLQEMSQTEAQSNYVKIVDKLAESESQTSSPAKNDNSNNDVTSKVEERIHKITINRPAKKNALTPEMYDVIRESLAEASNSDTALAAITGAGNYYCSGNDLTSFIKAIPKNYEELAEAGGETMKRFVASIIDFPKPLVAVVNGPAIGVMTTTLALFDAVYASDRATFHAPFSSLAMTPEGCSSFTFPLAMGHTRACDMLLFNKKLTAQEAKQAGLVTEVFPSESFQEEAWRKVKEMSELPPESLRLCKASVRDGFRQTLHETNERESRLLVSRWLSDEFKTTIFNFFQKKSSM